MGMANHPLEGLLAFALRKSLICKQDLPFCRNLLLDVLKLDAPAEPYRPYEIEEINDLPETATPYLTWLIADAAARGVCADTQGERDALSARLMGCLTMRPSEVCREFMHRYNAEGPQCATDWFYQYCRDVNYIRVDDIARNIQYKAPTMVGNLDITINLSRPEKDPRDIAAARLAKSASYPPCMLCVENPGYAGRAGFPARQNHRFVDLKLCGEAWHFQYSPYLYYNEHCIVFNEKHQPMHIDRTAFEKLFDFVSQFPHYFIGSNADLPIVGGSILSHDHFQGGRYVFPMTEAPIEIPLHSPDDEVSAGILDWPMSTLRLTGRNPQRMIDVAEKVLTAWRQWNDESLNILSYTDAPHNTITPILRRKGENYVFDLVLRNNRTTVEHPMGIFHPHADLHHIKMENIGLIEVMGLFILPGRLKNELHALESIITGSGEIHVDPDTPLYKHIPWINALRSKTTITPDNAAEVLRQGVADKCARVLMDAGVYKQNDAGRKGFIRFLSSVGFART